MRIPVVFTPHEGFAVPLAVALYSMFINANNDTEYDIRLFIPEEFSEETLCKLKSLFNRFGKHSLTAHRVTESDFYIADSIPAEPATYFRLLLPELCGDLDRCIYLDPDIVVLGDLTELYTVDVEGLYVAGVKAAGFYYPVEWRDEHLAEIGLPTIESYINAGVILLNLSELRKNNIMLKFRELYKCGFSVRDQDILNVSCFGYIKIIPLKWNAMTKYFTTKSPGYERGQLVYSPEEWNEADTSPIIIHYADRIKVWHDPTRYQSEIWFRYKELSEFDCQ